jgi:predicted DNA-binding transcriptional regulator AlpA
VLNDAPRILRMPDVRRVFGFSTSTVQRHVAEGLLPKSIPLSSQAVGWPEHEIAACSRAVIAGVPLDERRKLVQRLVASRAKLALVEAETPEAA